MNAVETVSVPGTPLGVRQAMQAFDRFSQSHQLPRGTQWRVLLALDEILSNVVRHARMRDGQAIQLSLSIAGEVVNVEIVDPGAAFNPLLAPPPDTTSPLEQRQPGGQGIGLVRQLMDETSYERRGNHNHFVIRCGPHADK
jgi:serine/threonine-protein kinase RsbW